MWSFDVYDTCLTRNYVQPKDVFREVALQYSTELEQHLGEGWVEIFTDTRYQAQHLASANKKGGEPRLIEIYKQVKKALPFIHEKDYIACELAVEWASLCPSIQMIYLTKTARKKHGKVIFISDMYLPHKFIKDALTHHGFFQNNDVLYVSSTYNDESKSNGRLFKRVLRDLKIHPSKLTHHGDDAWSDISQARQLSIKTRRINHCDLTKRENEILNSTSIISSLLSSRLIGHMRAQRVATPHSLGMNIYDDFTKNFSGPFLWLFAEWILGKAVKNEAQEIYFCSRDCLGLMIITERLAKLRKGSLKLRYVATSRQALVLATLRRGKESLHLKDLTEALNGLKLKEILQKIDIDQQFFLEFMRKNKLPLTDLNTILDSENKWEIFWQSLEDSSIRSHLNEIAANEQRSALQYFKEAGLLSSTKKIIVDFGWRQNCQSMIMDLIKSNKSQNQVTFLYLGLADRRNLRAASARAEALFYGSESRNSAPSNNGISKIIDKTQLIEVLMSCDPSDSIQSYQLDSPKCQYKLAGELKLRKEMNLSIERFARSIGRSFPLGEHDLRLTAIKLMDYWLESPKSQWHSLFKDVTTIKEAFRGSDTIIAEPLHFHLNHLKSSRILPLIAGRRASGSRAWEKLALSKTSLIGYFLFLPASIMTRTIFLYSRRLRISKPEHRVINTAINLLLMLSIKLKRAISNAAKSIRFIIEKSYD